MINTLIDFVYDTLIALDDLDSDSVFKYPKEDIDQFPYALINFEGSEAEDLTNREVERVYTIKTTIKIDISKETYSAGEAETIIRDLTDAAIDAFDLNRHADDLVELLTPVAASPYWDNDIHTVRAIDIILPFRKVKDSY